MLRWLRVKRQKSFRVQHSGSSLGYKRRHTCRDFHKLPTSVGVYQCQATHWSCSHKKGFAIRYPSTSFLEPPSNTLEIRILSQMFGWKICRFPQLSKTLKELNVSTADKPVLGNVTWSHFIFSFFEAFSKKQALREYRFHNFQTYGSKVMGVWKFRRSIGRAGMC
jgi:hypothetical protein